MAAEKLLDKNKACSFISEWEDNRMREIKMNERLKVNVNDIDKAQERDTHSNMHSPVTFSRISFQLNINSLS